MSMPAVHILPHKQDAMQASKHGELLIIYYV